MTLLDRVFTVGVVVKGIDGAAELIAGFFLWLGPTIIYAALSGVVNEAAEGDSAVNAFIADYVGRLDVQLATGSTVFLIVHGVVKLAFVYCLLRKYRRAYPWALGILVAFLVYQIYALVTMPTISMVLFVLLDVVIVVLVYREYRELTARMEAVARGTA